MKHFCTYTLSLLVLAVSLAGCGASRSSVSCTGENGKRISLYALSAYAKDGTIPSSGTAWFSFGNEATFDGALEAVFRIDSPSPIQISLTLVYPQDIEASGLLVQTPAPRTLSVVENAAGEVRIRMSGSGFAGFAASVEGVSASSVSVESAGITAAETGWQRTSTGYWAGFSSAGGRADPALSPPVLLGSHDVLEIWYEPAASRQQLPGPAGGSTPGETAIAFEDVLAVQGECRFTAGPVSFDILDAMVPGKTAVPAALLDIAKGAYPVKVEIESGRKSVAGLRVLPDRGVPAVDPAASRSPVVADPHEILEWPESLWRHADYEVFSWDRIPSVLIFDTADYAVQDRLFKRLAFFVEKKGYAGKLWTDSDLATLHAFNAHDYRAESLASFFELARKERFPLGKEELELEDILLAEGILLRDGEEIKAGSGSLISVSRESVAYLRYLFMAHEGFHGLYFTDSDFRSAVSQIYTSMNPRAVAFLQEYFTRLEGLGYDTSDPYLMENEFMGYIMQQPYNRVGQYFTENLLERFIRHGGNPELAEYIRSTGASDFVRASEQLNGYVFSRWGITGGRIGLFQFGE